MKGKYLFTAVAFVTATSAFAQAPAGGLSGAEAARIFGRRAQVLDISLSPDGKRVAIVSPGPGQATVVQVVDIATSEGKAVNFANGDPFAITGCGWVSDNRILCTFYGISDAQHNRMLSYSRLTAMDADGSNAVSLGARTRYTENQQQYDGSVLDWLDGSTDEVLLQRVYVPEKTTLNRIGSIANGLGVDRIDTRSLKVEHIESPATTVIGYIADGRGAIRMKGVIGAMTGNNLTGNYTYYYRPLAGGDWQTFGTYQSVTEAGIYPIAVDSGANVAFAIRKVNGRDAVYKVALDGSMTTTEVLSHPLVDIDGIIRVGRRGRVIGSSYATDMRHDVYFDPKYEALVKSLGKALGGRGVHIIDSSADESVHLVRAGGDVDPGTYYVFDTKSRRLEMVGVAQPEAAAQPLAKMQPITFSAADGTSVPGYLSLPPGSSGKGLPAIVMPHGGPAARDEWGYDWLVQFFVNRGFAVLQPNYRGSAGFGEDWLQENGFKSWKSAIGDVNDAGRWLVNEGIADPAKMAIFGWSYGGYAALQSGVLDPDLFKAVIAVAPVTDFGMLRAERLGFTNSALNRDYIGSGPHIVEGSPARNAGKIKAPVLMFHGDKDMNVAVGESRFMDEQLKKAGKDSQLIVYPKIDHQLPDSAVRADMLEKSDAFLRKALGL